MARLDSDGWLLEHPTDLAAAKSVDVETYSLARAITSEAGNEPIEVRYAIAWAIKNEGRRRGLSLLDLLTYTRERGVTHVYGSQYHELSGDGRYASTARDPSDVDLAIAADVISERVADPTYNASRFFQPMVQNRLYAQNHPGYKRDAQAVLQQWESEGWKAVSTLNGWVFLRHRDAPEPALPFNLASVAGPETKVVAIFALIGLASYGVYKVLTRKKKRLSVSSFSSS